MQEVLIKLIERVKELRAKEERQLVNYNDRGRPKTRQKTISENTKGP